MKQVKILSLILALAMILAILPIAALADGSVVINLPSDGSLDAVDFYAIRVFTISEPYGEVETDPGPPPVVDDYGFIYHLEPNFVGFLTYDGNTYADEAELIAEIRGLLDGNGTPNNLPIDGLAAKLFKYVKANWNSMFKSAGNVYKETATGSAPIFGNLPIGYYMVFGAAETSTGGGADTIWNINAITAVSLLNVLDESTEISPKYDAPTLDKEVSDHGEDDWGKWTDVNIGDVVDFKITTTVPNMKGHEYIPNPDPNYGPLSAYYFTVKDVMCPALSLLPYGITDPLRLLDQLYPNCFNEDGLTVTRNGVPLLNQKEWTAMDVAIRPETWDYDWTANWWTTPFNPVAETQISVDFNPKSFMTFDYGDVIEVTYSAVLNSLAQIAPYGNKNRAWLEYTNGPYSDGHTKTTSPESRAWVFTYDLVIYKYENGMEEVAGANPTPVKNPLAGAKFQLYKEIDSNGDPVGAPIQFSYVRDNAVSPPIVGGGDPKPGWYTVGPRLEKGSIPDSPPVMIAPDTDTLISPDHGFIRIDGLDAGTYYLFEIEAPTGYTPLAAPIKIVITHAPSAGGDDFLEVFEGGGIILATIKHLVAIDDGTPQDIGFGPVPPNPAAYTRADLEIENRGGDEFPGTGGIGVYIFCAIGGTLVLGAVIFMIVRRRRNLLEID